MNTQKREEDRIYHPANRDCESSEGGGPECTGNKKRSMTRYKNGEPIFLR
ncbi:hypothetical protein GGP65_002129 [Salinibacter ruber]|nr:hypothetical protein [Salinibacter ruber]